MIINVTLTEEQKQQAARELDLNSLLNIVLTKTMVNEDTIEIASKIHEYLKNEGRKTIQQEEKVKNNNNNQLKIDITLEGDWYIIQLSGKYPKGKNKVKRIDQLVFGYRNQLRPYDTREEAEQAVKEIKNIINE